MVKDYRPLPGFIYYRSADTLNTVAIVTSYRGIFGGMDRFRIKALEKIIAEPRLSEENRVAAINTLQEKARVYLQGAQKRGKTDEVAHYQLLINQYSS